MTLKLNVAKLKEKIKDCDDFQIAGKLLSVRDSLTAKLTASMGEICVITDGRQNEFLAEVIGVSEETSQLMTFQQTQGLTPGMSVIATNHQVRTPVGLELIGRVINAMGKPIDNRGILRVRRRRTFSRQTPVALQRSRVKRVLTTGLRVIDGLLTLGEGQRVGLFAGSGVGKSTLLGEIARNASSDVNVVALVGERGREVLPFIEDCLGEEGLRRSIVVVSTSDESPVMKLQAVRTAITIAEDLRDRGAHVLMFLDSLTRLAQAQREIGLARGEVPGLRGYPPSVTSIMASLLERLGTNERGAISAIATVLVDGDDLDEPISDAARSILDGHIVLDRRLASRGHFPAINVLESVSRVFPDVTSQEHQRAAQSIRNWLSQHEEIVDLVNAGLYQPGTSTEIDQCLQKIPMINKYLQQNLGETSSGNESLSHLVKLAEGSQ
ncbi:FliI/YscN family ATPase [Thalassoglobus sp. JC818]|uniref:FliI/YscN family ATPase n=1 Tax=Thalassoglobus sp. JC818 TaxID=3232136 RepID=UPI003459069E